MNTTNTTTQEFEIKTKSGFLMLFVTLLVLGALIFCAAFILENAPEYNYYNELVYDGFLNAWWAVVPTLIFLPTAWYFLGGNFVIGPNEGRAFTLFGNYYGSVKTPGYHWINGFTTGSSVDLKARNFKVDELKVNDKAGNPIMIGAVIVTRIEDTYKSEFEVQDVQDFVENQAESALRDVCREYSYDANDDTKEVTLRRGTDEIIGKLIKDLQERVKKAGVVVEDARITNLAYATEIAQAMLQRQQAEQVIAARKKIVEGSLAIVTDTVERLADQNIKLDKTEKARLVTNLLVVMVGDAGVTPTLELG